MVFSRHNNIDNPQPEQAQSKDSKWKVDFQIPYIDRVREDEISLVENFYKSSLIVLLGGAVVGLAASLLMFPPFNLSLTPIWMLLRVAGFIAGIVGTRILTNRGDNWGGLVFFYLRKFTGTQLFTAGLIYFFYDMVGLEPVYEFINLLFYTNISLYGAFLVYNFFKFQNSKAIGIVAGLGVIIAGMAILMLWFGMDPIIFMISGGYLLVLGLVDSMAMKESAEYNRHDMWMAGVLGVVWWNGFIAIRFGRVTLYLIYIVIMILAKK